MWYLNQILLLLALSISTTAFAIKHQETRLEIHTLHLSQSQTKDSYEISEEGDASTDRDKDEKKNDWSFYTVLPTLEVTVFDDGLVVGTQVFGFIGFVGGSLQLGYEINRKTEIGLYTSATYISSTTDREVDPEGSSSSLQTTKEHDTDRSVEIGPYGRFNVSLKPHKLEFFTVLTIESTNDDESDFGFRKEESSTTNLALRGRYIVPMSKKFRYFTDISIALRLTGSGTTETATQKEKLEKTSGQSLSLTLFGLRLLI